MIECDVQGGCVDPFLKKIHVSTTFFNDFLFMSFIIWRTAAA